MGVEIMTSTYVTPAQSAGQQASWTAEQWAAYHAGHAESAARMFGIMHRTGYMAPCTKSRLLWLLDIHGRTPADRAWHDQLAAAYRDAYDRAQADEQVPA
jgi:hypothetical protein